MVWREVIAAGASNHSVSKRSALHQHPQEPKDLDAPCRRDEMMWGTEDLHSIDRADREGVPDYACHPHCPRFWPSLLDTDEDAWAAHRHWISQGATSSMVGSPQCSWPPMPTSSLASIIGGTPRCHWSEPMLVHRQRDHALCPSRH
jgi:hypothetical protein